MLFTLLFTVAAHATAFDYAEWGRTASAADRADAVREYTYARERWMHDDTIRRFVHRDHTDNIWGDDRGGTHAIDIWNEPNAFENEIAAVADALIRLELDIGETYGLQPPQVWDSFYILNGDEHRLAPRAPQAELHYLHDVVNRVGQISPSLENYLDRYVTRRWDVLIDREHVGEDELAWRRRAWNDSQLYDHRTFKPEMLAEHGVHLGPDPTDALVKLEENTRRHFGLSREESWEFTHHLLTSWQNRPWRNSYRPRRYGPEPEGYREAMLTGIRAINALAHERLVFHLWNYEEPAYKFSVGDSVSPWALEQAEIELQKEINTRPIEAAVVSDFYKLRAKLNARTPFTPAPIDPAVAEELGARLIHARLFNGGCTDILTK